jgi:hypothetical protein
MKDLSSMMNDTTKRISILGTGIAGVALLTGLWLHSQKTKEAPARIEVPSATLAPLASAVTPTQAVADTDYRAVFTGIYSSEWLSPETTAAEDALFCDAKYCEHYLACLIAAGDLEWGTFLAGSGLTTASKSRFLELTAKKKLALKQAAIASRALSPETGRNERQNFLQSVSAEYDGQIKAEIGEALFSSYQAYEHDGMAMLVEPFFAETRVAGLALSAEQEKNLIAKVKASLRPHARTARGITQSFLAFDAAADESVLLSLDQVVVFREYQEALRSARKSSPRSIATIRPNLPDSAVAIRQRGISAFSKKTAKALPLETAKLDALKAMLEDYLLAGRITSDEFASTVTTLIGTEGFQKLITLAEQSALDHDLSVIGRKLRIAELPLDTAKQQKLRAALESRLRQGGASDGPEKRSFDFLDEDERVVVERHQRARLAAL